jgi:GNAT superfamily N-acetyltransferase
VTSTDAARSAIAPLGPETWEAFAALVDKHHGIVGGCWCTAYHPDADRRAGPDGRSVERRLVEAGRAHAALVMEDGAAIGWCELGSPAELPNIYHRKEYDAVGLDPAAYRLTCFFVDRDHRRQGVAGRALLGALALVGAAGGGMVEGYPVTPVPGKKVSGSFLFSGTRGMFERAGFEHVRPLGTKRSIMRLDVPAATGTTPATAGGAPAPAGRG